MVVRVLLTISCSVVIARWAYAELNIFVPSVVPYLDNALQVVQIPTHDNWEAAPIGEAWEKFERRFGWEK